MAVLPPFLLKLAWGGGAAGLHLLFLRVHPLSELGVVTPHYRLQDTGWRTQLGTGHGRLDAGHRRLAGWWTLQAGTTRAVD